MVRKFEDDLKKELQDLESAKYFGAARATSGFALTLALARKKLGITQQELAKKAGVSQAYIARLESGEANPTLERIGSLLAVLGLSLTFGVIPLSPYTEREDISDIIEPSWSKETPAVPMAREKKAKCRFSR
jgi:transcriptional regulator with XRE-family HTH domain